MYEDLIRELSCCPNAESCLGELKMADKYIPAAVAEKILYDGCHTTDGKEILEDVVEMWHMVQSIPAADVIQKNIDAAVKFLTECGWMKNHDEEVIRSCVPKWEKGKPQDEEEKYYLCYTKGGYQCICLWTDDIFGLRNVYINSEKKFGGKWEWSVHTKPRYDTITHFMPLPEPPKEGGSEE